MAIEKKKSKLEVLDERIEKLRKRILDNPCDEQLLKQLRRLKNFQLYTIQKQTRLFGDYMKFEMENNYFREEEL